MPRFSCFLLVALVVLSCSSPPDTPEEQIRKFIEEAADVIRKQEGREVGRLIGEEYADDQGRDKRTIRGMISFYFMQNESIYLATRIRSIDFPAAGQARAKVVAAVAGQPIPDPDDPAFFRTALYRFELHLAQRGSSWAVVGASWERASLAEFF
jgi:hypothetical protein